MTFETLKRSHLKRNVLIAIGVVLILTAVILTFTRAKYRTTQSMPLLQGTINFSPSDFNMIAVYLNKNDETVSADKVPHVGYTLNEEQSTCESSDGIEESIGIEYIQPSLTFSNVIKKGTKCSVYFDLIPDSENPTINNVYSSTDDSSITVTIDASDNIGIYYYYFQLDTGEEVRSEENVYTFEGLTKDDIHTITIKVEDAAGNEASNTQEVTVGLTAKDVILAHEGGAAAIAEKGTPDFATIATADEGMYAAEDDWGTSYYYRGAVNDNWIQFGTNSSGQDLYWRIIRINGDGTIRLIYNGTTTAQTGATTQIQTSSFNSSINNYAYVGYMYTLDKLQGLTTDSEIKTVLDTWYQNNLTDEAEYIEGSTGFCGDRSSYSMGTYAAFKRLASNKAPVLTCTNNNNLYTTSGSGQGNKALTYPIGLITADEASMAGGVYDTNNSSYYLYTGQHYWTMSPQYYMNAATVYRIGNDGYVGNNLSAYNVAASCGVRPVINLKANTSLSGAGTTTDPYTVNMTN